MKLKHQTTSNLSWRVDYLHIPTVEEARNFFGPIAAEERAWRGDVYFNALLKSPRSRLGLGEHDRVEAHVLGNGVYPEADKEAHQRHFPLSVKVMQIDELFLAPHEVVDLTTHADEFPWNVGKVELYLHVTVNRLILSTQSKLMVKGNVFFLNCLKAIGNDLEGNQAIIELSGADSVQHSILSNRAPQRRIDSNGSNGANGEPLKRESTPLGSRVSEGADSNKGQKGAEGVKGVDGTVGSNGAMLFLSDLRFGQLEGFQDRSIKLKASAAPGFPGGNGGDGGDGGNGGKGASGAVTPFGIIKGCQGGRGGRGGDGGNGGRGGSGGLACDVFVSVPHQKSFIFHTETFASPGGRGGDGGKGGKGGAAGINGDLYEDESRHSFSLDGEDGVKGMSGRDGKTRTAPNVHIYERQLTN